MPRAAAPLLTPLQVSGDMRTGRIDFPRVYEDVLDRLPLLGDACTIIAV